MSDTRQRGCKLRALSASLEPTTPTPKAHTAKAERRNSSSPQPQTCQPWIHRNAAEQDAQRSSERMTTSLYYAVKNLFGLMVYRIQMGLFIWILSSRVVTRTGHRPVTALNLPLFGTQSIRNYKGFQPILGCLVMRKGLRLAPAVGAALRRLESERRCSPIDRPAGKRVAPSCSVSARPNYPLRHPKYQLIEVSAGRSLRCCAQTAPVSGGAGK